MKTLNKIFSFSLLVTIMLTSCSDDFLEKVDPNSTNPDSFFVSVDAVEQALFAAYATQANIQNFNRQGFWMLDMPADDVASKNPNWTYDSFQWEANDGTLIKIWRVHHLIINRANQTIKYATENELEDREGNEAILAQLVAEAKFLRSLYQYFLTMHFGDIPYKNVENLDETYTPKTAQAIVLENIVGDLTSALPDLLSKSQQTSGQRGRATKAAANTLLARVKLAQQDWVGAEAAATAVIDDNYSLLPNLRDIHNPFNPFSDESIYEIVYTYTGGGNHDWGLFDSGGNSPSAKSSFRSFWNYRPGREGQEGHKASDKLIAAYDSDDPRLIAYYYGPTSIVDGGPHDFANQGWTIRKFIDDENTTLRETQENFILFRLADVILIRAEARAMQDNLSGALSDLNSIRSRAREGNPGVVPDFSASTKTEVMEAIKHERFIELSAEVVRLIDIRRWGDFDELAAYGFRIGKDELFPIPQSEMDNNINITENNPGW